MKKLYTLAGGLLFSSALLAQGISGLTLAPNQGNQFTKVSQSGNESKAVTGTITAANGYLASTSSTLNLIINLDNTDLEYGDSLHLTFPAGFTVTNGSSPIGTGDGTGELFNSASGTTVSWGDNDNYYGGMETGADLAFSVDITVAGGITGAQTVNFFVSGDGFGGSPADFSGSFDIFDAVDNDLVLNETWYYSRGVAQYTEMYDLIPLSQAEGDTMYFDGAVENVGLNSQTNVNFNVDITGAGTYSNSMMGLTPDLAAASVDTILHFPPFYHPSAMGVYNVNFNVSADETDDNPGNNSMTDVFEVVDTAYSWSGLTIPLDDGSGSQGSNSGADPYIAVNLFQMFSEDTVTSVSAFFQDYTISNVNVTYDVVIYDGTLTPILTVPGNTATLHAWNTVMLPANTILAAGYYYIGISVPVTTSGTLVIGEGSEAQYGQNALINSDFAGTGAGWFLTGNVFAINANLGHAPQTACTLTSSASVDNNVSCNGGTDGSATATAIGGQGTITYSWSNGAVSPIASGLAPGTYTVTITDDIVPACTATESVTITEPTAVTASASTTDASANGLSDGTATVVGAGGTSPYTYMWDAAAGNQTTATATGLAAGTYDVTVTDANGCTTTTSATVSEPSVSTAIDETTNNAFEVYPNPNQGNFNVKLNNTNNNNIVIRNVVGQVIYSKTASADMQTVSLEGVNAGVYLITVGNVTKKFIIK